MYYPEAYLKEPLLKERRKRPGQTVDKRIVAVSFLRECLR
jgi:hypothetical protein